MGTYLRRLVARAGVGGISESRADVPAAPPAQIPLADPFASQALETILPASAGLPSNAVRGEVVPRGDPAETSPQSAANDERGAAHPVSRGHHAPAAGSPARLASPAGALDAPGRLSADITTTPITPALPGEKARTDGADRHALPSPVAPLESRVAMPHVADDRPRRDPAPRRRDVVLPGAEPLPGVAPTATSDVPSTADRRAVPVSRRASTDSPAGLRAPIAVKTEGQMRPALDARVHASDDTAPTLSPLPLAPVNQVMPSAGRRAARRASGEGPKLVIGNLTVEVSPPPTPTRPAQRRRPALRPASQAPNRSKLRFGLGQV